jgi:hypothetical protein
LPQFTKPYGTQTSWGFAYSQGPYITNGEHHEQNDSAKNPSEIVEPTADADAPSDNADIPATALTQFWLRAAGTAKKLGLRSTGSRSCQVPGAGRP